MFIHIFDTNYIIIFLSININYIIVLYLIICCKDLICGIRYEGKTFVNKIKYNKFTTANLLFKLMSHMILQGQLID